MTFSLFHDRARPVGFRSFWANGISQGSGQRQSVHINTVRIILN